MAVPVDTEAIIRLNATMTSGIRPYYASGGASAVHYDLITAHDRSLDGDIDLYAGLIPPQGSVLELGTGTGRIAIPLAERGFTVTGLDIAASMLAQAEAHRQAMSADAADRLRFVRGDMRSLALGQRFHTVIVPYFTLAHVQPATAWKQVFSGIAHHLRPGGRVAAHLPLVDKLAGTPPSPGTVLFQAPTADGESLALVFVEQNYNPRAERFDLTLDYVVRSTTGGERSRSRERYTLFHANPRPFAERAGLLQIGAPAALGTSGEIHIFEKPV